MRILFLALLLTLTGCKKRAADSSEKAITESKGRVFGLLPSAGQGNAPTKFEFRLCTKAVNRAPIDSVMDDPTICINPYKNTEGNPLVITGQTFASIDEAEAHLKSRGFRKGATVATVGAVGGTVVAFVGGAIISIPFAYAAAEAGSTGWGGMAVFGASVAGVGAATSYLGYSIWGAADRDAGNNIEAIMQDFHEQKTAGDVVRVVKTFGDEMKWNIAKEVASF